MAVNVVGFKREGYGGTVTIEAPTFEEINSAAVREAAIQEAVKQGIPRPGLSAIDASPYPVNAKGEVTDAVMFGKEPVAAYRIDYVVQGMV